MIQLNAVYDLGRRIADRWRDWFLIESNLEATSRRAGREDDERDAEAREKEQIDLAILRASFHF